MTVLKLKDLDPRAGKTLRYVCSYSGDGGVVPEMCVRVSLPNWPTNLPQNKTQARLTLELLARGLLIKRNTDGGYDPLPAGVKVVLAANKKKMWRNPLD